MKKAFVVMLSLIVLASCRSKYEALMVSYTKTQARISKITDERKKLQKEIPKLTDSINRLLVVNHIWKKYFKQSEEIKNYKLEFYNDITNGKQSVNNTK
jgi:peptidoglycan hydrolase CwlO-like protein